MTPDPIDISIEPGVVLRGQRWAGNGLTVLLLHEPGMDADLDRWRPLVPYILGAGFSVIAVDLRGHGASDGEFDLSHLSHDIAATMIAVRGSSSDPVVVCAAAESGVAAISAATAVPIDGIIALSPQLGETATPRGAGEPKCFISGAGDVAARDAMAQLLAASIGPARSITLPAFITGTQLIASEVAQICREHILTFLREVQFHGAGSGRSGPLDRDRFLDLLGIHPKGVNA